MAYTTTRTTSSSRCGKIFLYKMWKNRHDLSEDERKGFAQYFYITMSGHVESLLVTIIKTRLTTIECEFEKLRYNQIPIIKNINREEKKFPMDPVLSSVISIASSLKNRVETVPLSDLLKIYDEVFSKGELKSVVGGNVKRGLLAISQLRNVFAHGRDILMYFDSDNPNNCDDFSAKLDKCSLGEPIKYLQKEKIFDETIKWNATLSVFFEDKVILHFYEIIRNAQSSLIKERYEFEALSGYIDDLPILEL